MIIVGLIAIPYMDKNPMGNGYYTFKQRPFAITTFLMGFVILWVVLIIFGTFLRGPNWNFFGPFEPWDVHKVVPMNNIDLSEVVWIKLLSQPLPDNIVLRESPGIIFLVFLFGILPGLLGKKTNLYAIPRFLDGANISQIEYESELAGFSEFCRKFKLRDRVKATQ